MFITEEESNSILKNPRNLANRIRNGRLITPEEFKDAEIFESGPPTFEETFEEEEPKVQSQNKESQCVESLPARIEHRELRRPGNSRPWLSKSERNSIAADYSFSRGGILTGKKTQTEIAAAHGVQVSTVSDIVNGKRRVEDTPRSVDQSKVDAALDKVREAAIDKLMAGLGHLTDDKVSAHNAKDISVICANMARVVQQTIPQDKVAQQINLVVYTPELRAEKNFDSVEV